MAGHKAESLMTLRQSFKRMVKSIFLLLVFPVYALYLLLRLTGSQDAVFASFSQALSLIPGKIGIYVRAAFYRLACANTSDEISVGFLTVFSHADTTIQKGVYIGPQCNIGKCIIGKNTLIGSGVHILSGSAQHIFSDIETPIQEQGGEYIKISVGIDCWIGNKCMITSDIPNQCVVGTGTLIKKMNIRPGDIIVGNPAQVIKNRITTTS